MLQPAQDPLSICVAPRHPARARPPVPPVFPQVYPVTSPLLLASGSPIRRRLLEAVGINVEAEPSGLDEESLTQALRAENQGARAIADALAEAKALKLSLRRPGRLVLGADQTLDCEGELFSKPADMAEATRQLAALQGRSHRLHSAAALAEDGRVLWRHVSTARLAMRALDETAIEAHLARAGSAVLGSVGAYHVEGPGLRLFTAIEGDLFTVMGLPLLAIVNHLVDRGFLAP